MGDPHVHELTRESIPHIHIDGAVPKHISAMYAVERVEKGCKESNGNPYAASSEGSYYEVEDIYAVTPRPDLPSEPAPPNTQADVANAANGKAKEVNQGSEASEADILHKTSARAKELSGRQGQAPRAATVRTTLAALRGTSTPDSFMTPEITPNNSRFHTPKNSKPNSHA